MEVKKKKFPFGLNVLLALLFITLLGGFSTCFAAYTDDFTQTEVDQINEFFNVNYTVEQYNIAFNYVKNNSSSVDKRDIIFVKGYQYSNYICMFSLETFYNNTIKYFSINNISSTLYISFTDGITPKNPANYYCYYYRTGDQNGSYENARNFQLENNINNVTFSGEYLICPQILTCIDSSSIYYRFNSGSFNLYTNYNHIVLDDDVQPVEPDFRPWNGVIQTYYRGNSGDVRDCIGDVTLNDDLKAFYYNSNYSGEIINIDETILNVYLEEIEPYNSLSLTPYNYDIINNSNNIYQIYNFDSYPGNPFVFGYSFYYKNLISYMKTGYIYRLHFDYLVDRGNNNLYTDFCTSPFFALQNYNSDLIIVKNIKPIVGENIVSSGEAGVISYSGDTSGDLINNSLVDINQGIAGIGSTLTDVPEINQTITSGDIIGSLNFSGDPYENFWLSLTNGLRDSLNDSVRTIDLTFRNETFTINLDDFTLQIPQLLKIILGSFSTLFVLWRMAKWIKLMIDKISSGGIDSVLHENSEERRNQSILKR